MNKRPDDPNKHGDVVPVDAPKVPAVKKPPDKWKLHGILANNADYLVQRYDELGELRRQVQKRKPGDELPDLKDAELTDEDRDTLARCDELLKLLNPDDLYVDPDEVEIDDCDWSTRLKRDFIAKRLGLMLAAMPVGKASTPDGYVKMLLTHIADTETDLCPQSLEDACRAIERTSKFLPTIPEVLAAISEHKEAWDERHRAMCMIAERSHDLKNLIVKLQPQAALDCAKAKMEETQRQCSTVRQSLDRQTQEALTAQAHAREAHQRAERAMITIAKLEQDLAKVEAAATAASDEFKRLLADKATEAPKVDP